MYKRIRELEIGLDQMWTLLTLTLTTLIMKPQNMVVIHYLVKDKQMRAW